MTVRVSNTIRATVDTRRILGRERAVHATRTDARFGQSVTAHVEGTTGFRVEAPRAKRAARQSGTQRCFDGRHRRHRGVRPQNRRNKPTNPSTADSGYTVPVPNSPLSIPITKTMLKMGLQGRGSQPSPVFMYRVVTRDANARFIDAIHPRAAESTRNSLESPTPGPARLMARGEAAVRRHYNAARAGSPRAHSGTGFKTKPPRSW